jgi:hypothetical protein
VYCHDNIIGLRCSANTRNVTITNSRFLYNDVNNDSGADGILMTRSVIGAIVDNCDLGFSGEHGLYFQGQRGTFTNNRVFNNHRDGLKFGSYDDGASVYPGEVLDTWVPGSPGVPGFEGVLGADGFGLADIVIAGNVISDNGGDDGIYFQPSSRNVIVDGNALVNNSIRWVYFNYTGAEARLEDHLNIQITNNTIRGIEPGTSDPARISISAYSGIVVSGNTVDGEISTLAADASTAPRLLATTQDPQILNNNVGDRILFSRCAGGLCEGNLANGLSLASNSSSVDVIGNEIKNAANIDIARINVFSNNKITCTAMVGTGSGSITSMVGNDVTFSDHDPRHHPLHRRHAKHRLLGQRGWGGVKEKPLLVTPAGAGCLVGRARLELAAFAL